MYVFYDPERRTSTQRIAQRIGAIPPKKNTHNFNYVTTMPILAVGFNNLLLLNGLVPGSGGSERVGRHVFMTTMTWRCSNIANQRFMIVYDRQSNGQALTGSDLMQDTSDQFSPYNFSNKERFDVLMDSLYNTTPELNPITIWKDFPIHRDTIYNSGTAGTVADITTGSLYLVVYSTAIAPAPSLSFMLYYYE